MDVSQSTSISQYQKVFEAPSDNSNPSNFHHRKLTKSHEMADADHTLLNRTPLKKSTDAALDNLKELFRFNISQPFINLYNTYMTQRNPDNPACIQVNEQHMQNLFERDYENFLSYSTHEYLEKTNENIFGQDKPLIKQTALQKFTGIIKSLILGEHNKATTDFQEKLSTFYDSVTDNDNIHINADTEQQLKKSHVPTPETIIAKLKMGIEAGIEKEKLIAQLQKDCEQLTAFLLKTSGMAAFAKSLKLDTPLNSSKSTAQKAAGVINKTAAYLSDKVPPFYLSILGTVLLERMVAGDRKADALNDMMSAPALNISTPVREKVVAYARNLYRAEKIDDVGMKPANVVTTSMAFTLYITGSLQLLISRADHSNNSELMDKCFQEFIQEKSGSSNPPNPGPASSCTKFAESALRLIGITSIGLRALMNGAYEIKDATPDNELRDTVYNSVLGKSFVPLSLIENAGYKDDIIEKNREVLLQQCLTKGVLGEPLTDQEEDFMKSIRGEPGSAYSKKSQVSKAISYGTAALSTSVLTADIATALASPEASKNFWSSPVQSGGAVTWSHVYKGAVRPISAVVNLLQIMWVSGRAYTKDDVEAFVHISSRLVLATAPLIMWEKGLTLWDSIAAIIDTAITVGEDSAASRSLNKGQLAKQVEVAVNNLRLQAHENSHEAPPDHVGRYMDQLTESLFKTLSNDDAPVEMISTGDEESSLRKRSSHTHHEEDMV